MIRAAILLAMLACLGPARAADRPAVLTVLPPLTIKDAFADPYGRVMVKEFGAILVESADPACLAARNLPAASLPAFGEDFLVRHGQGWADMMLAMVDAEKADAGFLRLAGADALEELRRLLGDPIVARYIALTRPAQLDTLVNKVTEEFDRYALLTRLGLVRQLSPVVTGSALGDADRTEASEDAAARFAEANDTAELRRFTALIDSFGEAMAETTDREQSLRHGPIRSFPGAEAELRAHCIR